MKASGADRIRSSYWAEVLVRRMPFDDEVSRLVSILIGEFVLQSRNVTEGVMVDAGQLSDFVHSKRPYGNKDIAASIAFKLGWDYQRKLQQEPMPPEVEAAAMALHEALVLKVTAIKY